jgi:hypothetical protein
MKVQDVDTDWKQKSQQWLNPKNFQLIVEIGGAIHLPKSKAYKVKVQINDWSWTTDKPTEVQENYCRYS